MRNKILGLCIAVVSIAMMTSCTGDAKMKDLLSRVPSSADYVFVGNMKTIVESSGGSIDNGKLVLPSELTDMDDDIEETIDKLNDYVSEGKIDIDAFAIMGDYDNDAVAIIALNDEKQFKKLLDDENYDESSSSEGVTYYEMDEDDYYKKSGMKFRNIAVSGVYAYAINPSFSRVDEAERTLKKIIRNAADESYADTGMGSYIAESNAFGLGLKMPKELRSAMRLTGVPSEMLSLYEGVVCMKGSLTDKTIDVSMKFLNEDGSEKNVDTFKEIFDATAKVNPNALKYMSKDEQMVIAGSLKEFNWDKYLSSLAVSGAYGNAAMLAVVKAYLEKLDGTIAMGYGIKDGISSIGYLNGSGAEALKHISFTFVAETKPDRAKGIIDDIKALLKQQDVPFKTSDKGIEIEEPSVGLELHINHDGNFLIAASHKISTNEQNKAVGAVNFAQYIGAGAVVLSQDDKLMKDLGLKNGVKLVCIGDAGNMEVTMTMEIDGEGKGGVLRKIIDMVKDVEDYQNSIKTKMLEEESSKYDEVTVDSVVVDPAAYDYAY